MTKIIYDQSLLLAMPDASYTMTRHIIMGMGEPFYEGCVRITSLPCIAAREFFDLVSCAEWNDTVIGWYH